MPHNRFFIATSFANHIELKGDELHHFRKVMRGEVGDEIECVNGRGDLAKAVVEHLTKEVAVAKVVSRSHEPKSDSEKILAIGLIKPANLELAIEKATELGVDRFFLFPADRSEKEGLSENQLKRLHTIIQSACKQCGRLYLPEIVIKKNLQECFEQGATLLFGDVAKEAPPLRSLAIANKKRIFIVGPESGLSPHEEKLLKAHSAQGVSLHTNILRAETATIAASLLL